MSIPDFRIQISDDLKHGRALLEEQKYSCAIKCANECGSAIFKAMTNEVGPNQELLFSDLKQSILLLFDGFRKSQCEKCFADFVRRTFNFLFKIRSNTNFSIWIRQGCGEFINSIFELAEVKVVLPYLPPDINPSKKYHLVCVADS